MCRFSIRAPVFIIMSSDGTAPDGIATQKETKVVFHKDVVVSLSNLASPKEIESVWPQTLCRSNAHPTDTHVDAYEAIPVANHKEKETSKPRDEDGALITAKSVHAQFKEMNIISKTLATIIRYYCNTLEKPALRGRNDGGNLVLRPSRAHSAAEDILEKNGPMTVEEFELKLLEKYSFVKGTTHSFFIHELLPSPASAPPSNPGTVDRVLPADGATNNLVIPPGMTPQEYVDLRGKLNAQEVDRMKAAAEEKKADAEAKLAEAALEKERREKEREQRDKVTTAFIMDAAKEKEEEKKALERKHEEEKKALERKLDEARQAEKERKLKSEQVRKDQLDRIEDHVACTRETTDDIHKSTRKARVDNNGSRVSPVPFNLNTSSNGAYESPIPMKKTDSTSVLLLLLLPQLQQFIHDQGLPRGNREIKNYCSINNLTRIIEEVSNANISKSRLLKDGTQESLCHKDFKDGNVYSEMLVQCLNEGTLVYKISNKSSGMAMNPDDIQIKTRVAQKSMLRHFRGDFGSA